MRKLLTLMLLIPLVACGDEQQGEIDFGGEELGPDRYSVVSDDEAIKMGLTDQHVYFAIADSVRAEAQAEMEREVGNRDGVAGMIGGVVQKAVGKAMSFRARYPVEEIRDIRWENGQMRIEFVDPDRSISDSFQSGDRPITEAFSEQDVQAFAEHFRQVKAGQAGAADDAAGTPAEPAPAGGDGADW